MSWKQQEANQIRIFWAFFPLLLCIVAEFFYVERQGTNDDWRIKHADDTPNNCTIEAN